MDLRLHPRGEHREEQLESDEVGQDVAIVPVGRKVVSAGRDVRSTFRIGRPSDVTQPSAFTWSAATHWAYNVTPSRAGLVGTAIRAPTPRFATAVGPPRVRCDDQFETEVPMSSDDVVVAVLNRLENENRQLKRVLVAVLVGCVVLTCTAMAWQDKNKKEPRIQNVLRTRRLELANANGEIVAVLQAAATEEEPGWLTEYHDNGRPKWRAKIKNNRYGGEYTEWYPNGLKSEEGRYSQGRKHGQREREDELDAHDRPASGRQEPEQPELLALE